ncbi:MAG TPA: RNA polymerase sigma factor [Planctomycetota bacterium]|nr:RNA polymerase sigma factor [Planctomycetota bacterium]
MDEPSDGQLLDAFQRGDSHALSTLIARHQSALLRHARSIVGSDGSHEDVVQEAFMKLVQRPLELPAEVRGDAEAERALMSSWLHKVVRNQAMDSLRAEKRRRHREEAAAERDGAREHGHAVEENDTRAAVERGLSRLPADQREVLVLRLLSDKSYREIAEITGKKVGTVGWLVSVGLRALSQELAPLFGGTREPRGAAVQSVVGQAAQGVRS